MTTMENERLSANALAETLNGFDEIAISKAFGEDISELRSKPFSFLRALIFIEQKRNGSKDAIAYKAAMEVRTVELDEYFPDDPEEVDPDEPVTDEGKDGEPTD